MIQSHLNFLVARNLISRAYRSRVISLVIGWSQKVNRAKGGTALQALNLQECRAKRFQFSSIYL